MTPHHSPLPSTPRADVFPDELTAAKALAERTSTRRSARRRLRGPIGPIAPHTTRRGPRPRAAKSCHRPGPPARPGQSAAARPPSASLGVAWGCLGSWIAPLASASNYPRRAPPRPHPPTHRRRPRTTGGLVVGQRNNRPFQSR